MSRRLKLAICVAAVVAGSLALNGCSLAQKPIIANRETLGTVVTITAYGPDRDAVESAVDASFSEMAAVELALNAYPSQSANESAPGAAMAAGASVSQFNRSPYRWQRLDTSVVIVIDRLVALDVTESFSPSLRSVVDLWGFDGSQTLPDQTQLEVAVRAADTLTTRETTSGVEARFIMPEPGAPLPAEPPGLDLSGAAKGLALDSAVLKLREDGDVTAALLTSGSTTVTFGDKPDKTPWRIGIEDPRDPEHVIAVVEVRGEVTVSTSGDYQQYFERDDVRYHHILDPVTGMPARGLRSLTVIGAADGLDSDILSTALFVMGPAGAEEYARQHELGLVMVDDAGTISILDRPPTAQWRIVPQD